MSSLLEELTQLREQIDYQRHLHEARTQQQNERIEKLREERELKKEDMNTATEKLNERTQVLNTLLKGITQIFEMIRCEKSPMLKLLGTFLLTYLANESCVDSMYILDKYYSNQPALENVPDWGNQPMLFFKHCCIILFIQSQNVLLVIIY